MLNKKWYVYIIIFLDSSFYIGYRGSKGDPNDDFLVKYMSSSKVVKERITSGYVYFGIILKEFSNKEQSYNYEQDLIDKNIKNPLILNKVCFKDRKGFGLLTQSSSDKISKSSYKMWQNDDFKKSMSLKQKESWTKERRESQSNRLINEFWTEERKNSHSEKMRGRKFTEEVKEKMRKPKCDGHGKNVSKALSGVPKSKKHRESLSRSKQGKILTTRKILQIIDHLGNEFENERRFCIHYKLSKGFYVDLDKPIRYSSVYDKLDIPNTEENRLKTKRQLGFHFK
jgi:hypothetical protein